MSIKLDVNHLIEKTFNGLKKLSPALFAILFTTATLLFSPQRFIIKLRLINLPPVAWSIIGILFVLSLSLIITIGLHTIFQRMQIKRLKQKYVEQMCALSDAEKVIVMMLYQSPAYSAALSYDDARTGLLFGKQIIFMPTTSSTMHGTFTFNYTLRDWAKKYIDEHPDFCSIPAEELQESIEDYKAYYYY